MKRIQPQYGKVYSLSYMLNNLELRDMPSLNFEYGGKPQCIQTSHCKNEALLAVPGMAESLWVYERETYEWIPVFNFAPDQDITLLVDMEESTDPRLHRDSMLWVTPKTLPRKQYDWVN